MTAYSNYIKFLGEIFGEDKINIDEDKFINNNIVGAIDKVIEGDTNFIFFVSNFKKRLIRLNSRFKNDDSVLEDIIIKAQNIAKKKWFGEYSELVVYDFFNSFFNLETEIEVDKSRTYASIISGRTASSFDGRIIKDEFDLTFEIKSLTDISKALLDNIISSASSRNSNVFKITVGYNHDIKYGLIENNFSAILSGLNKAISEDKTIFKPEGTSLKFSIYYKEKKVITTESTYGTMNHAEALQYFVLNHFDQIFINEKNMLVYVVHPWFNLLNTNDFLGKKEFIMKFATDCFSVLSKSENKIKETLPKWSGVDLGVKEVATRISGILFLFDNNVIPHPTHIANNDMSLIEASLFINNSANEKNLFTKKDIETFMEFSMKRNFEINVI